MDASTGPPRDQRFFPIPVDSLDFHTLEIDLYLSFEQGPATLYRATGVQFRAEDAQRLVESGVRFLLVPAGQHGAYLRALSSRLTRVFKDPARAAQERARIVRESCSKIIENVLLVPGRGETFQAVSEVSRTFAAWCTEDPNGFSYLLDMAAHDFGTATHMVNVGVGCGLLVRELRPQDPALFEIAVQGGMLHDIGKRGIPESVINKEGKLSAAEWKLVSSHPERGYKELKINSAVPEGVLSMTRDHHEQLAGGGYPRGLKGDEISFLARVCAIVDVFDAITSSRPYRGPTPPADTLKLMAQRRGSQFDEGLFDTFIGLVEGMIRSDPSRAVPASSEARRPGLVDLLPAPLGRAPGPRSTLQGAAGLRKDDRRRFGRIRCDLRGTGVFHHQGKPLAVGPGERFPVRIVDIARGGLLIVTPWPMTLGDTLTVEMTAQGTLVSRITRVVRVRKRGGGTWSAGLAFIDAEEAAA